MSISDIATRLSKALRANLTRPEIDFHRIGLYIGLVAMIGFFLVPIESGFMTSLKTQFGVATTTPFAPPTTDIFALSPWSQAWQRLQSGMINSLLFALPATAMAVTFGSLAAYGLTMISWRGNFLVLLLFVAAVFVPYQTTIVPLFRFWSFVSVSSLFSFFPPIANRAGLFELFVTHGAFGISLSTVLFRGYYITINNDIIEAAMLDGCSHLKIYRRVVLPLSKPMFGVTFILVFTGVWNELLWAIVLVDTPSNYVATQALMTLQGSMINQYNLQMAGALIVAAPTLLIYALFGKQFAEGITAQS